MKKAIIVGASSGIGKGLAKLLTNNDYKVGITGRRTNLLTELKNENPDRYVIKAFDITDTNNISQQLEELINELGGLDLLIISSGTGNLNDNLVFEIEKQTSDTNVSGFTALAGWAFNYLEGLRQKSNKLKTEIVVTDIRPGFIDTDMAKGEGQFWVASVDKASRQIINAIKNKRKIVYITRRWRLIATLLKLLPRQIYDRM